MADTRHGQLITINPGTHQQVQAVVDGAGRCRSCGRAILWCKTSGGRLTPVDQGTLTSHFVSCPNAAAHRRRKSSAEEGGLFG